MRRKALAQQLGSERMQAMSILFQQVVSVAKACGESVEEGGEGARRDLRSQRLEHVSCGIRRRGACYEACLHAQLGGISECVLPPSSQLHEAAATW